MVQVAVSVIVLVAAILFLHSLWNGFSIDLGFRPENLLVVKTDPTAQGYSRERSEFSSSNSKTKYRNCLM